MSKPNIRIATDADLDRVTQMWLAMYAHQREHGMLLSLHADAADMWRRKIATQLDTAISRLLIAESESGLIGFLSAQIKRLPPHLIASTSRIGFISEVFVEPSGRQHGTGRALVSAAFDWMDTIGVGSVELQVLAQSPEAQAFWRRMGFAAELLQMRAMRQANQQPLGSES
jgi:GNAT superfamily N-acetyltransferase